MSELLRAFKEHESPTTAERDLGFAALRARLEDHADEPPAANGRFYGIAKATLITLAVVHGLLLCDVTPQILSGHTVHAWVTRTTTWPVFHHCIYATCAPTI